MADLAASAKLFVEKLAARYAEASEGALDKKVCRREFGEAIQRLPDSAGDLRQHIEGNRAKLFDAFWSHVESHVAKTKAAEKEMPVLLCSQGLSAMRKYLANQPQSRRPKLFEPLVLLAASSPLSSMHATRTDSLLSLGQVEGVCGKEGLAPVCVRIASQAVSLDQLVACMETFFRSATEADTLSAATLESLDKLVRLCVLKTASFQEQRTQQYNDLLAALLSVLLDHTVVASEPARVYDRVISIVSAALAHSPEHMLDTFLQMKPASRGHVEVAKAFAACLAGMAGAVTATPLGARTFLKLMIVARDIAQLQSACAAMAVPSGLLELLSTHSGELAQRFVGPGKSALHVVLGLSSTELDELTEMLASAADEGSEDDIFSPSAAEAAEDSEAGSHSDKKQKKKDSSSKAAKGGNKGKRKGGDENDDGEEEEEEVAEDVGEGSDGGDAEAGGFFIDTVGEKPANQKTAAPSPHVDGKKGKLGKKNGGGEEEGKRSKRSKQSSSQSSLPSSQSSQPSSQSSVDDAGSGKEKGRGRRGRAAASSQ